MATEETTVSDRGMVTIPAKLRRRLDIEPGRVDRVDVAGGLDQRFELHPEVADPQECRG